MYRALVVIAALPLLFSACDRGAPPPRIGTRAPDFTLQDSDRRIALHDLRGKVVVLNFWASYCVPCIEETPSLEQLQLRLENKGVVVVGISSDFDADEYHKFLTHYSIDFPTVREGDTKTANMYGTEKIPETYIIDRKGIIRRKFISSVDWSDPEIVAFLSKL